MKTSLILGHLGQKTVYQRKEVSTKTKESQKEAVLRKSTNHCKTKGGERSKQQLLKEMR